ncbi:MAG: hypothetical protein A4E63_03535 [Syntrophorhabdus sp. PtaU1.Bin050]|nr:MAG: hypothetical protein A4E63_03535 [Syntrophorhabdus sp. PtaU1.Bin050]
MKHKKAVLAGAILVCVCIVIAGLFVLVRSPFFLQKLGAVIERLSWYRIEMERVSLSPAFRVGITKLSITRPKDGAVAFASSQTDIESGFTKTIKGEVEKIILTEPKLRIRLGDKKDSRTDLSFIKKLPPVDLLTIKKGEFRLLFASSPYEIILKNISVDVRDFSPKRGGRATLSGILNVVNRENPEDKAQGSCRGEFNLTGLFPAPVGRGVLEATIESGTFNAAAVKNGSLVLKVKFEDDRIVLTEANLLSGPVDVKKGNRRSGLKGLRVKTDLTYETKSGRVYVRNFKGEVPGLGAFEGSAKGTAKNNFPWQATVEARDIDFTVLFAVLGPLVEKSPGDEWSVQGKGTVKAELEGTMSGATPGARGRATLQLSKGGFSSKDGTKAAQGIEGAIVVRFSLPSSKERKKEINASLSLMPGEYLWGKYYKDFSKVKTKALSIIDVAVTGDHRVDFSGTANLFDTGKYLYRGSIDKGTWGLSLGLKGISNKDVFFVLLSEYVSELYPSLKGTEVGGSLDAEINSSGKGGAFTINGFVDARNTFVRIPEKSLTMDQVDMSFPLNLSYPSTSRDVLDTPREDKVETGRIGIKTIRKGPIDVSNLEIPVAVSENTLWLPEGIAIPFFGGYIKILRYKVTDLLSPSRKFYVTAGLQNVDLGSFMRELTGLEFPGTMEARFPMITYQDDKWTTGGKTSVKIFGGEVGISNFYAQQIFSASRKIGGDIDFHDINLGSITETIKIGKITGVVKGSLKDLEIEYGQPSRFVLEIESVKKRGVKQKVSVDAIENISILGTGSGGVGMILKGGLNRFFKEYPYSRIGILCTLENDNFHVRGTIREGNKEYLMRRALFRGIDIINRDPENTISFRDMQERVSRVFHDREKDQTPQVGVN